MGFTSKSKINVRFTLQESEVGDRFRRPDSIPAGHIEAQLGEKIAPCPFCHSENLQVFTMKEHHISCCNCGADGPIVRGAEAGGWGYAVAQAIGKWNDRTKREVAYNRRGRR